MPSRKPTPAELIREAYDAGQRIFGESHRRSCARSMNCFPKDIEWHMIGHLQTNKVKYIAPFVQLIHSVDSARLAEAIQTQAARCGRVIDTSCSKSTLPARSTSRLGSRAAARLPGRNPFAAMPATCVCAA